MPKFIVSIFDKEQRPLAVLKNNDVDTNIEIKNKQQSL